MTGRWEGRGVGGESVMSTAGGDKRRRTEMRMGGGRAHIVRSRERTSPPPPGGGTRPALLPTGRATPARLTPRVMVLDAREMRRQRDDIILGSVPAPCVDMAGWGKGWLSAAPPRDDTDNNDAEDNSPSGTLAPLHWRRG
jgi:hypothetical protein